MSARIAPLAVMVAFGLTLAGCGDGFSGSTYADEGGTKVEFRSGDKVFVTLIGTTMEGTYKVDGDKVTLIPAGGGGNLVLTKQDDGTLDGGLMVGKLKKK